MKKIFLFLSLALAIGFAACSDDDETTPPPATEPPMVEIDNLREAPYPIGGAIGLEQLKSNEKYRQTVIKEMSSISAENAMKMDAISRGKGNYFWDDADYIVNFAIENNMRVHGHTLIWHNATPSWVQYYSGNKDAWKALMKEYIQDVMTHFKGKVISWDVVNEAFMDDGTYRSSVWYQKLGVEYIELAFQYAHEADPDAILFYNDYGQEYSHAKNVAINKMIDGLLAKNIPVHGVGFQMHTNIYQLEKNIAYALNTAASRNLKVHISEFDVGVNPEEKEDMEFTDDLAKKQKAIYRYAAKAMLNIPAELQHGITLWGVNDTYSWLNDIPDWPLPFDKDFNRKTAYEGFLQGFYKE